MRGMWARLIRPGDRLIEVLEFSSATWMKVNGSSALSTNTG